MSPLSNTGTDINMAPKQYFCISVCKRAVSPTSKMNRVYAFAELLNDVSSNQISACAATASPEAKVDLSPPALLKENI